jgi:hypothetical protein
MTEHDLPQPSEDPEAVVDLVEDEDYWEEPEDTSWVERAMNAVWPEDQPY